MKTKSILNFRYAYDAIFTAIRRVHMQRLVRKIKSSNTGGYVLTKEMENQAKTFWSKYRSVPMVYHNFYTEKTGRFCPEYIPDEIYYNYVQPYFNNYRLAKALDNKCYYSKMFPDIAQPAVVAYRLNGFWFSENSYTILDDNAVVRLLNKETDVFVKCATDSGGGRGVKHLECGKLTVENWQTFLQNFHGDVVVQRAVKQHEALARFNPSSVNTLRLFTLLEQDKTTILSVLLRMGIGDTKVDNTSSGGMSVGVTLEGKLKARGSSPKGVTNEAHPVSGVVFADYLLPSFDKVKEMVIRASREVPHFRLVAWDVAIQEDGTPVLIEANLYDGQLDSHQLNNGPLFGPETERIMNEVFEK